MRRHGLPALPVILVVATLLLGCELFPSTAPEIQVASREGTVARGECTILEWVVEGAEGYPVFLNGEEVDSSGWKQVCPEELTTYELVVGAPGGPYEERVTVVVEGEPGPGVSLSPTSLPPTTMTATPTTPPSVPSPTTKPPTPTTPPPPPAPTSTSPPPAPQPYTLELINQSGVTICHVRFTDPSQPPGSWGDDQLGGSLIGDGQSRTLEVPVGREYVIVEDCQGIQFGLCVMSSSPQSSTCTIYNMAANLVLHNNSGQTVSYVYIVPSPEGTNGNWGDDQLGASETIAAGATRTWPITATRYDLRAVGESGQDWNLYDVEMPTGMTPQSYDWTIQSVAPPGNLVLTNNSGQTICYVYISLSTDSSWGSDQLATGETVGLGQSRGWEVPPGTYDLKAEDCGHNVLDTRFSVNLAAPYQWTIP